MRFYADRKGDYDPKKDDLIPGYDKTVAARKFFPHMMRAARKIREPRPYRCSKCGAVVRSLEPVRWCPVGEHFMRQPSVKLQAGWRYVA